MAAGLLLAELGLEAFEPAFCRLGAASLEQLAEVRYEELLEIGLSKVQCCLFLERVSSYRGATAGGEASMCLRVTEVRDEALANSLAERSNSAEELELGAAFGDLHAARAAASSAAGAGGRYAADESHEGAFASAPLRRPGAMRRTALQTLMPPPNGGPVTEGALSTAARSSRKRPHSSHLSTGAARGSEIISTAGSASGSSSSSHMCHPDMRRKQRRVRAPSGATWLSDQGELGFRCGGSHGGGAGSASGSALRGCEADGEAGED